MAQILRPENIPDIVKATSTTITFAATNLGQPTRINFGGQQYSPSSGLTLTTSTTGLGGLDTGTIAANTLYYVYAVMSAGSMYLICSTSNQSVGPTGYSSYKWLGRFRTAFASTSIAQVSMNPAINSVGYASSDWVSDTFPIFATTTNPTRGSGVIERARWRRVGSNMEVRFEYSQSGAGSHGSGLYYQNIPGGWTADTSKFNEIMLSGSVFGGPNTTYIGVSYITTGAFMGGTAAGITSLIVCTLGNVANPPTYWASSQNGLGVGPMQMRYDLNFPVAEWQGLYD